MLLQHLSLLHRLGLGARSSFAFIRFLFFLFITSSLGFIDLNLVSYGNDIYEILLFLHLSKFFTFCIVDMYTHFF